jgi:transcription elongation factor GreB
VSRAFLSESDEAFMDDDVPETKDPLPPGVKNYMTPEGAGRLRRELDGLVNAERPGLLTNLSRAVTEGGAPEKEGMLRDRRRLREIERRIEYIERMLDRLDVVDPDAQDPSRVLFGATVTVRDGAGGEKAYRIVGIDESEPSEGRVSWISPVAKALLGKRVGDAAAVALPKGIVNLKIVKIEYSRT